MNAISRVEYERLATQLDAAAPLSGALPATKTSPSWPEPLEIKTELPAAPLFDATVLLPPALADFVLDEKRSVAVIVADFEVDSVLSYRADEARKD